MMNIISIVLFYVLLPYQAPAKKIPAGAVHFPVTADQVVREKSNPATIAGKWYLVAVLPSDTAAGKIPYLNFDLSNNRFTGNTGCNTMKGSFQHSGLSLVFQRQIVMTKRACLGYNETAFMDNLLKVDHYKIENGVLILMSGDAPLSKWTRKPVRASAVLKT